MATKAKTTKPVKSAKAPAARRAVKTPAVKDAPAKSPTARKPAVPKTPAAKPVATAKPLPTPAGTPMPASVPAPVAVPTPVAPVAAAPAKTRIAPEDRFNLIQHEAYLLAEKDGFRHPPDIYWFGAENLVEQQHGAF